MNNENVLVYTMETYSTVKTKEIMKFASQWIELENIILGEVTQIQTGKYHMLSLICEF